MKIVKKCISLSLCAGLILQLASCGTILYPDRKGQQNGRLDPAVVILDAIGLLFFIIPGVIAFAVDFSNGTIYLPGGGKSQLSAEQLSKLRNKQGKVELKEVNQIINEKTERSVVMTEKNTEIFPVKASDSGKGMLLENGMTYHPG